MDSETAVESPAAHESTHEDVSADETRLLARAQAGDAAAFETLIHRYRRRILGIAFQMVGNYDDAQDICQEVCLRLFRFLDHYDPRYRFFTWLYRLVVNASLDLLGRRKRHAREGSLDEELEAAPGVDRDPSPGPDALVEGERIRTTLAGLLESLTPQQRAAFLLRDVEGLPGEEVATIMGCGMGTVRTHLHFARKKIRDEVRRRHPDWLPGGGR